jgi:hypothetical protein
MQVTTNTPHALMDIGSKQMEGLFEQFDDSRRVYEKNDAGLTFTSATPPFHTFLTFTLSP